MGLIGAPRNCWYVAGASKDFATGELEGRVICNRPIVMWRAKEGDVLAYDDRCGHCQRNISERRESIMR